MNKIREQNKMAEIAALSDYDIAASNLRSAATCVKAAGKATTEMGKWKWLKLAQSKLEVASSYVDDLQNRKPVPD